LNITGTVTGTGGNTRDGFTMNNNGVRVRSLGTGNITINGIGAGASNSSGITFFSPTNQEISSTGGGTITLNGSGASGSGSSIDLQAGMLIGQGLSGTYTGNIVLSGNSILGNAAIATTGGTLGVTGQSIVGAGNINTNGGAMTFTLAGAPVSTLSGIMSGAGSLTKAGAGTLTLSGANTYTGATNVNAGTLTYGVNNALADTSAVSVASGATFNLAGFTDTIASLSSVAGGIVTLGNGSLTTSGAQNYGGQITGGNVTLASTGGGAITANNTANDFTGTVNLSSTGAVSVVDANALTLGNVAGGSVNAQAITGNLTAANNILASTAAGATNLTATAGQLLLNGGLINTNNGAMSLTGANGITSTGALTLISGTAATNLTTTNNAINVGGALWLGGHTTLNTGTAAANFSSTVNSLAVLNNLQALVVAGGGGGGGGTGGGGGAGGLIYNPSLGITAATNYAVTVGTGGTGGTGLNSRGNSGTNSAFSTLTALGGGGGGSNNGVSPLSGGAGGGGDWTTLGAAGTAGQGNGGGNGAAAGPPNYGAGGGGGAGSAGSIGTTTNGGNGGAGVANTITGSSVTYAGGGGGGIYQTAVNFGLGGSGGGGNGGATSLAATNGVNGLGGGGGGAGNNSGTSGTGGSGVVIVRYTGTAENARVTGGVSSTVGGDTVWTFSGNGSFTPYSGCVGGCNLMVNAGSATFGGAVGGVNPLANVAVNTTNALTLPSITAASILARNTGAAADITLGGNLNASATSGDSIILAAGRDVDNSGNRTLTTAGTGRWQIYSGDAVNVTQSVGGLTGFNRYGCTYTGSPSCAAGTNIPASGNGFYYAFSPTLTITPTALAALTYGDASPSLVGYGYAASGYLGADSGADTLSGALTGSTNYTPTSNVGGSYNINYASGALTSALGYSFSYGNNASAITVGKKQLTATANNQTITYGTSVPAGTMTYSGFANSENSSVIDILATLSSVNSGIVNAGSYIGNYTASGAVDNNYDFSYVAGDLTVNKALLTATANGQTITYGAIVPSSTITYTGFVNSENSGVIDTLATLSSANSGIVNAGTYAGNYSASGALDNNYSFAYVAGDLIVLNRSGVNGLPQNFILPPTFEQTILASRSNNSSIIAQGNDMGISSPGNERGSQASGQSNAYQGIVFISDELATSNNIRSQDFLIGITKSLKEFFGML